MARKLPDGSNVIPAEWNRARQRAIAAHDHTCAICSKELDHKAKQYSHNAIEVDHIIPVARGGHPYDLGNLQLACPRCNRRKGKKLDSDYTDVEGVNPLPISSDW